MRLIISTRFPPSDLASVGFGGDLLYVNTSLYWFADSLLGEYAHLLHGFERVTVPLLASIHPREWRKLLFLSGFVQEKAPGPGMQFPPMCCLGLLPLVVASAGEYMSERGLEARVALWADFLDRDLLGRVVAAGVESSVKDLWLVYVYTRPALYGDMEIGSSPAAYFYLKIFFPRMTDRVSFKLEEKSLRFNEHLQNYRRMYRRRQIDLLELAFRDKAGLARDVLQDVIENGGSLALKSLLDFTREDKDYKDIFHRLVDYGYLKMQGVPPQITITEKGLYALGQVS